MSDIPANARKYIKQVKANRQKQKQKQSSKQTTTVIINQPTRRTRAPNKPKSAPSSGGGGGGPSVIPYVIPQTQLSAASYQNSAVQPPSEIQQLTQALGQFQQNQNQIYRNPLRMAPFRTAMNPPPMQPEEQPLPEPAQAPPPPDLPDIVLQPNRVEQLSREPQAVPIRNDIPTVQGFVHNQAVNDLDRQTELEVYALNDYGGLDAESPREGAEDMRLRMQEIDDELQANLLLAQASRFYMDESPIKKAAGGPIKAGGGGGRGRPFTEVTPFQQHGIELYLLARQEGKIGDRAFLNNLSEVDKKAYDAGRLLVTAKNRNNNPYVADFIRMTENKFNK